jgi:hypothetical protein
MTEDQATELKVSAKLKRQKYEPRLSKATSPDRSSFGSAVPFQLVLSKARSAADRQASFARAFVLGLGFAHRPTTRNIALRSPSPHRACDTLVLL